MRNDFNKFWKTAFEMLRMSEFVNGCRILENTIRYSFRQRQGKTNCKCATTVFQQPFDKSCFFRESQELLNFNGPWQSLSNCSQLVSRQAGSASSHRCWCNSSGCKYFTSRGNASMPLHFIYEGFTNHNIWTKNVYMYLLIT